MTLPKILFRGTLLLLGLLVAIWFWLLHTHSGASFVWARTSSATDGALSGELLRGNFGDGVEIRNFGFSADTVNASAAKVGLTVDVDLLPLQLNVSNVVISDVEVAIKSSNSDDDAPLNIDSILSELRLPIRIDLREVSIAMISVLTEGSESIEIERLAASLFWHNELLLRSLRVQSGQNFAALSGNINLLTPTSVNLNADATYDEIKLHVEIVGDQSLMSLQNILADGDFLHVSGSAELSLIDELAASADVQLGRFDLSKFSPAWPASFPLAGELKLEASTEAIRIFDAAFVVTQTDANISLDANYDLTSGSVNGNLAWSNLKWPIDTEISSVESADASLSVGGNLEDWQVQGTVAVGTAKMADGRFRIVGGGDRDKVVLTIQEGKVFGGSIAGEVEYSWRANQPWSTAVEFQNLGTADVLPDWPGQVSGHANASGTQVPFAIHGTLKDVNGVIRQDQFHADGSFRFADEILTADELSIRHGGTELFLNGSADTPDGIEYRASIDAIERYVEIGSGALNANGRLSTVKAAPYLSINLDSDELIINDVFLSGIRLSDARTSDSLAGFELRIDSLQAAGQDVIDVALLASVRKDLQTLALSGMNRGSEISLELEGAFNDWESVGDSPWEGNVLSLMVALEDEHALHLERPAAIHLASERLSIDGFCLADEVDAHLCVDATREADGQLDLKATLTNVPLALLEHVADTGLKFEQRISGTVSWLGEPTTGATGAGSLELSPGQISSIQQSGVVVETGKGNLTFEITDGDFLQGTASIPLPGLGGIDADFRVLHLTKIGNSDVEGHLNAEIADIAAVALFSPLISSASGKLDVDLDLLGSIVSPLLTGTFGLEGGSLDYRPIGLRLDEINLTGDLTENKAIELSGRFRAGEGYGEIISSADYRDIEEPGLRFKIDGDELLLIDVPDIQLVARPNIEFQYSKESIDINGSILVERARVAPANLAEGRISESDDVVVVAGQVIDDDAEAETQSQFIYDGFLEIELGDEVVVDLDIAKANLKGKAVFDWQGDPMPIVNGRYDLNGSIQAFGQVLEISEGGIRYANVPASEPYLRIRAEREIYGNSQVKRAGVLVDGPANRPTIEPYTNPITTDERALTLLVTGSDFDYEQGVGAIDFGTYIAPKLFVSYGVGVFDRENIISARYDLAKGFGVKATSGSKESGVDLNYRFEN